MLFGVAPNERVFVRLICRSCPVGTVITTGDQLPVGAVGFNDPQVAVDPPAAAPQL